MEPDRDPDLCDRSDWIAIDRTARNRVWNLGSGVFVAWRSRRAPRRLALFRRLDEHARRIRADAATTLADDGRSGGIRRDSIVWCEYGVHFRCDAGVLVNARRAHNPQQKLTRDGSDASGRTQKRGSVGGGNRRGAGELWEPRSHREVPAPDQPGRRARRTW